MKRNIFEVIEERPYLKTNTVILDQFKGTSTKAVRQRIEELHATTSKKVLEVSTASKDELGVAASAFNLLNKDGISVERMFQSSKIFELGGPYREILEMSSSEAKKYPPLKKSGRLVAFNMDGRNYSLSPGTAFYNWLYINTLIYNQDVAKGILEYEAFTDIWFNPDHSINCQAQACAVYCGLVRSGNLDKAMKSFDDFVRVAHRRH